MLGTTRPGVTIAVQELERRGWITNSRGVVCIIDRKALEKASNGAYVPPIQSSDCRVHAAGSPQCKFFTIDVEPGVLPPFLYQAV